MLFIQYNPGEGVQPRRRGSRRPSGLNLSQARAPSPGWPSVISEPKARAELLGGGVVREPLLRPHGLVSMTTPTANWPEFLKAVVLEVLGQPADPGV